MYKTALDVGIDDEEGHDHDELSMRMLMSTINSSLITKVVSLDQPTLCLCMKVVYVQTYATVPDET